MVPSKGVEFTVKLFVVNKAIELFNRKQSIEYKERMIIILLSLYKVNNSYGLRTCDLGSYLSDYKHTCSRTILSYYLKECLINGLVVKNRRLWVITSLGRNKIKEFEGCLRSVRMRG